MRVKCLAQEHNTTSPRSGVERTNHEATAPLIKRERETFFNDRIYIKNVIHLNNGVDMVDVRV